MTMNPKNLLSDNAYEVYKQISDKCLIEKQYSALRKGKSRDEARLFIFNLIEIRDITGFISFDEEKMVFIKKEPTEIDFIPPYPQGNQYGDQELQKFYRTEYPRKEIKACPNTRDEILKNYRKSHYRQK